MGDKSEDSGMSGIVFKELTRSDVLEALAEMSEQATEKDPEVDIEKANIGVLWSTGERMSIFKAVDEDGFATVYCAPEKVLMMAPLFGSKLKPLTVSEFVRSVGLLNAGRIRIGKHSLVGKVVGAVMPDGPSVWLLPVPMEIEEISAFIVDYVKNECMATACGQSCANCVYAHKGCKILDAAEKAAKEKFTTKEEKEKDNGEEKQEGSDKD